MLAPITHILPLTRVQRTRLLPVAGRVVVHEGQMVNANDVIAEAPGETRHYWFDIRRVLGIPQMSEAVKCIERRAGDRLEKGDVIAHRKGIFPRYLRAPAAGQVMLISGGQILFEVSGKTDALLAGMPGKVTRIIPERGAILDTSASLIQGMWGNGKSDSGLLISVLKSPEEEFLRAQLDVNLRGSIVLGGFCAHADVLKAAADLSLRGLIVSSMTGDLASLAQSLSFPVISLEGFGRIPLNLASFRLLVTSEKREVFLNACVWDPFMGDRPELIIPITADAELPRESDSFRAEQMVRIQGGPQRGKIGQLSQILPGLTHLKNGLNVPAAWVRLEQDKQVLVPLANLEVIE